MALIIAPFPKHQFFDDSGNPLSGGTLTTYIAGTTTPVSTFSDSSGTLNANPITLDAAGRVIGLFLTVGSSYKFLLKTSAGATVWTFDNISTSQSTDTNIDGTAGATITAGQVVYLSDGSGALTAGRWYPAKADNAYSSTLPQVGFAVNNITTGTTGSIRLIGRVTGLSVSVGLSYYISSATAGAITSVAPTLSRLLGVADSATTLIISPNPSTSLTGFTNHGVILGQGTSSIVATAAGTTGQLLAGVTSADPSFQTASAVGASMTLLKSGSGTSTAAGATTVDSIAITGLTALDSLMVVYEIESATQLTAIPLLFNVTDAVSMTSLDGTQNIAAGATSSGVAYVRQRQSSVTAIKSWSLSSRSASAAGVSDNVSSAFTTNWTGAWTLGLRHGGVTAGGTFSYTWAVYRLAGQ